MSGGPLGEGLNVIAGGPFGSPINAGVATDLIVVAPHQMFTVVFDVTTTANARLFGDQVGGGEAFFYDTLKPAAALFTDAAGNGVAEVVTMGPFAPPAPPSRLTLTAPAAAGTVGETQAVTATALSASGAPVADAVVRFRIVAGPNAGLVGGAVTSSDGAASFSYPSRGRAGTGTLRAEIGALASGDVEVTWAPGPLDHLVITPVASTAEAGAAQAYTVEGRDGFDNSLGDLTSGAVFSIAPDGSCVGAAGIASVAGAHVVTASAGGSGVTATFAVIPAAVDHIVLSPAVATVALGDSQLYAAQAFDRFGNLRGTATAETTFAIAPDGSCASASCSAPTAGPHVVTGTFAGVTATASLTVTSPVTCGVGLEPDALAQPYLGSPYAQLLLGEPLGRYTFRLVGGALPPGLRLGTVLGAGLLAGVPTAPGTYNFIIGATGDRERCEGTRSYRLTIPGTVTPFVDCIARNANRTYTAIYGYENSTGGTVTISVGPDNLFTPGPPGRGQASVFGTGGVTAAFRVTFGNGDLAAWLLKGPDRVRRVAAVSALTATCR